jgi:hypothetical protein
MAAIAGDVTVAGSDSGAQMYLTDVRACRRIIPARGAPCQGALRRLMSFLTAQAATCPVHVRLRHRVGGAARTMQPMDERYDPRAHPRLHRFQRALLPLGLVLLALSLGMIAARLVLGWEERVSVVGLVLGLMSSLLVVYLGWTYRREMARRG